MSRDKGSIPVIDFNQLTRAGSREQEAKVLVDSLKTYGCVIIRNHSFPLQTVEEVFQNVAPFFELPQGVKEQYAQDKGDAFGGLVGYQPIGGLRVNPERNPDCHEAFVYASTLTVPGSEKKCQIKEIPSMKENFVKAEHHGYDVAVELLRSIAVGLELENDDFFTKHMTRENVMDCVRFNFYTPLEHIKVKDNQIRFGEHEDHGILTLLFTDGTKGLQVCLPDGKWEDVVTDHTDIFINAGLLLKRWTGDLIKAVLHRVTMPDQERWNKARMSIAYLLGANPDVMVTPIDGSKAFLVKDFLVTSYSDIKDQQQDN